MAPGMAPVHTPPSILTMIHEHRDIQYQVQRQDNGLWEYWFVCPDTGRIRQGRNKTNELHAHRAARMSINGVLTYPDPPKPGTYIHAPSRVPHIVPEGTPGFGSWTEDPRRIRDEIRAQADAVMDAKEFEKEHRMIRPRRRAAQLARARYALEQQLTEAEDED